MLTLRPSTVVTLVAPTVHAGRRLDVHSVDTFLATVEREIDQAGAVHVDATETKHLDKQGLAALTRLVERRRNDLSITIDAGPAVQIAAMLDGNETLAAAVLPLTEAVAA
ncbi:MAG: hypothetical protein AAGA90_12180 [Actinomycetota bacterium]